jgi:hypothetical protein
MKKLSCSMTMIIEYHSRKTSLSKKRRATFFLTIIGDGTQTNTENNGKRKEENLQFSAPSNYYFAFYWPRVDVVVVVLHARRSIDRSRTNQIDFFLHWRLPSSWRTRPQLPRLLFFAMGLLLVGSYLQ